ncbi:NAD(P)/FAD-dependent oxidoreductase [Myxococcota bacterium]|nr:NAD(P)/FAD-dependent oxidoreductase [Myxococcota bacterium]
MLDWVIVGGGPHGVHIAARLIAEAGVSRQAIKIVDDEEVLLARWRRCTANSGMRFLRSPAVHHLDPSTRSLQQFARSGSGRRIAQPFTRPYSRPSLELFDLHCEKLIEHFGLEELHIRGRANRLELFEGYVRVGFSGSEEKGVCGQAEAKNGVLALGAPRQTHWPEWARRVGVSASAAGHPSVIRHIFDPGFNLVDDESDESVAVIGAGISGVQVALRLAREGRRVILLSRHPIRVHQFDSDPGWQGPMYMAAYSRLSDPGERRARILKARHRGSVPPEIQSALRAALSAGTIEHLENVEVESACFSDGRVALACGDRKVEVDRVLLATGFPAQRPGGEWLDEAIELYDLPCADCGYPLVDRGLRWHPRLFVMGSLAELEIGPVSRNLSGAQRAGERIVAVARGSSKNVNALKLEQESVLT